MAEPLPFKANYVDGVGGTSYYDVLLQWDRRLTLRATPTSRRVIATSIVRNYSFADLLFDLTDPSLSLTQGSYDTDTGRSDISVRGLSTRRGTNSEAAMIDRYLVQTSGPKFMYTEFEDRAYNILTAIIRTEDPDFHEVCTLLATAGSEVRPEQPERLGEYILALMDVS